jgi:ariadne-1
MSDDELGFKEVESDAKRLKDHEIEFVVHSLAEITAFQNKESNHVAGIIDIAPQHAATLLRHFGWNKELLVERYMENPEKILSEACVIFGQQPFIRIQSGIPDFVCEVCYDEGPEVSTMALHCGHRFCIVCYDHYLKQKICEEGESRRITCMGKCSLIVDEKTVKELVDAATYKRYAALSTTISRFCADRLFALPNLTDQSQICMLLPGIKLCCYEHTWMTQISCDGVLRLLVKKQLNAECQELV